MSKPVVFALLVGLAVLAAGVFGMLHNQLSYSVGPDYFEALKFEQFGIADDAQNRWGAAIVGWKASWWMGLVIGLPAFALGLVWITRPATLLAAGIGAIGLALMITLFAAMVGLLLGMTESPGLYAHVALPDGLARPEGFLRAALMHEASYFGGLVGLLAAILAVRRAGQLDRALLKTRI